MCHIISPLLKYKNISFLLTFWTSFNFTLIKHQLSPFPNPALEEIIPFHRNDHLMKPCCSNVPESLLFLGIRIEITTPKTKANIP